MKASFNLAEPAPYVEPAHASPAPYPHPVNVDRAEPVESPKVDAAGDEPVQSIYSCSQPIITNSMSCAPLSVICLRKKYGAEFEGYAAVLKMAQGPNTKNVLKGSCLFMFGQERETVSFGEVKRYILVQGSSCLIYTGQNEAFPLHAISLDSVFAVMEDKHRSIPDSVIISPRPGTAAGMHTPDDYVTVFLVNRNDHSSYIFQFTFDTRNDAGQAKRFFDVVVSQSARAVQEHDTVVASILESSMTEASIVHDKN